MESHFKYQLYLQKTSITLFATSTLGKTSQEIRILLTVAWESQRERERSKERSREIEPEQARKSQRDIQREPEKAPLWLPPWLSVALLAHLSGTYSRLIVACSENFTLQTLGNARWKSFFLCCLPLSFYIAYGSNVSFGQFINRGYFEIQLYWSLGEIKGDSDLIEKPFQRFSDPIRPRWDAFWPSSSFHPPLVLLSSC